MKVGVQKPRFLVTSQGKLWGIIYIPKFRCGIRLKAPSMGLCLKSHPCFAFPPLSYPTSSSHFPVFPGSISLIDSLLPNSHFIVYFWGNLPKTFETGIGPRTQTLRMGFWNLITCWPRGNKDILTDGNACCQHLGCCSTAITHICTFAQLEPDIADRSYGSLCNPEETII